MVDRLKGKVALVVGAGSIGPGWANGKATEVGGVVEVSEAEWDRVFAVNLKGAYFAMKQTIPFMIRQGGGSIINISLIASIRYTGVPYATCYASKAALNQLTKTTAVEYASRRIRVNAILPGLMKTPGTLGLRFILPATRAATSLELNSSSTAGQRSNMSKAGMANLSAR